MKRIFISCVTKEFESLRIEIYKALRTSYEVDYQESFAFEPISLKSTLLEKLKRCDGIIHIVGDAYGSPFPADDPDCNPDGNISYTQWELRMVEKLNSKSLIKKKIWLIFPGPDCTKNTPLELLDWVESPEIDLDQAYGIQQYRRELQSAYRESLLDSRNNYAFRKPKNDFECKDVIAAIVKKEKRARNLFAMVASLLLLIVAGGGFMAYQKILENGRTKEINEVQTIQVELNQSPQSIKYPYHYKKEQSSYTASLFQASLNSIYKKDQDFWQICVSRFQKMHLNLKSSSNVNEDLDSLIYDLSSSHKIYLTEITQAIIGYLYIHGHYQASEKILESQDCGLSEEQKCECLFEISYQEFKIAELELDGKSDEAVAAVNAASAALSRMNPKSEVFLRYQPDRLRLLYRKAFIHFLYKKKNTQLVESSIRELSDEADRVLRYGEKYQYLSNLYKGLSEVLSGRLYSEDNWMENLESRGKIINHYVQALSLLQQNEQSTEETNHQTIESLNPSAAISDSRFAATECGSILTDLSELFSQWSSPLLHGDMPRAIQAFEKRINSYTTRAHEEDDSPWGEQLKEERVLFAKEKNQWGVRWNDTFKVFDDKIAAPADNIVKSLRNFPKSNGKNDTIDPDIIIVKLQNFKKEINDAKIKFANNIGDADVLIDRAIALEKTHFKKEVSHERRILTAIEECLRELDIPNLNQAKQCCTSLENLVKSSKDKKEIQDATELINLIQNVFRAEAGYAAAKKGVITANNEADIKEERAKGYEVPGPLGQGRGRLELARQHRQEAQALRLEANDRLANARNAVREQIRQTALAAKLYDDNQRQRGAAVLAGLAHALIARNDVNFEGSIVLTKNQCDEIKNDGKLNE